MLLADGDLNQYDRIKQGSVGDYLVKLENYVQGIEREVKRHKHQQAKAKR